MVAEQGGSGAGVVLANFGRSVLVLSGTETLHCGLTGRKQRVVCGDRVTWSWGASADGPSIDNVAPRRNLVERIDARGRPESVAANVDSLDIVVAPEPQPDWFLVDRYWAGARLKDIDCTLVVNKADLPLDSIEIELANYRALRLPCLVVTAKSQGGIEALRQHMDGHVSMLVGQSGVGKSSLVNALVPEAAAQTAQLTRDAEGRHTTTTARCYQLGSAAAIIDAPGVRDFAPPASILRPAEGGFVEVHEIGAACRFKDCNHMEEPGCAVRSAVVHQRMSARRYESYRRLFRLYGKLAH